MYTLEILDNELRDVYDGRVWNRFKQFNDSPFLDNDHTYAFMINMDWFQPYKHLTYSVGAIYLSVFNLPRSVRYQLQNICLVGIIPGPREPELTVTYQYIRSEIVNFEDACALIQLTSRAYNFSGSPVFSTYHPLAMASSSGRAKRTVKPPDYYRQLSDVCFSTKTQPKVSRRRVERSDSLYPVTVVEDDGSRYKVGIVTRTMNGRTTVMSKSWKIVTLMTASLPHSHCMENLQIESKLP